MAFKKGDWIIRINDGSQHNCVTKGKAYKVLSTLTGGHEIEISDDNNKLDFFSTINFRFALPDEIPQEEPKPAEFKVGDWVVFQHDDHNSKPYLLKSVTNRGYIDQDGCYRETNNKRYRLALPNEIPVEHSKQTMDTTQHCGLKVGDALPKEVLQAWCKRGKNYFTRQSWESINSSFCGDRTIVSFDYKDAILAFLVSGTAGVYLRAEGFKDFSYGYSPSKEVMIQEAKRRYRPGTRFNSLGGNLGSLVPENPIFVVHHNNDINLYGPLNCYIGIVYDYKKCLWADIVSSPKDKYEDGVTGLYYPETGHIYKFAAQDNSLQACIKRQNIELPEGIIVNINKNRRPNLIIS